MGICVLHAWPLEQHDGGTAVNTEESWQGLLLSLLPGRMRTILKKSLDAGLRHLKAEAGHREKRT